MATPASNKPTESKPGLNNKQNPKEINKEKQDTMSVDEFLQIHSLQSCLPAITAQQMSIADYVELGPFVDECIKAKEWQTIAQRFKFLAEIKKLQKQSSGILRKCVHYVHHINP